MYYKVIRKHNNKLYSAISRLPPKAIVEYEVNKWIEPNIKDSKIFFFDDLLDAIRFKNKQISEFGLVIYECEVGSINHASAICSFDDFSDYFEEFQEFWIQLMKQASFEVETLNPPSGSKWTDKIKLLREVN